MKWPWVSRATYDHLNEITDRCLVQSREALRMAEQANVLSRDILGTLERLIVPRGTSQVTTPNPLPIAVPERNDLTEAIELASGTDRGLARHLTRWAKEQALDGVKERDIIQSILHWPRATEWDGEPGDVPESAW